MDYAKLQELKLYLDANGIWNLDDKTLEDIINSYPEMDVESLGSSILQSKQTQPIQDPAQVPSQRGRKFTTATGSIQSDTMLKASQALDALSQTAATPGQTNFTSNQTLPSLDNITGATRAKPEGGLGHLLAGLGWGLLDTVSFGLADYMSDDENWDVLKSTAGQIGQGAGTAAGFLIPMGVAKGVIGAGIKGVKWGVGGMQSTAKAVNTFKTVSKTKIVADIGDKATKLGMNAEKIADDVLVPMSNSIWSAGGGKPFSGIASIFKRNVGGRNSLSHSVDDIVNHQKRVDMTTKKIIKENIAKATGGRVNLSNEALISIEKEYLKILGSKGNMPIHSLEEMLFRSLGNSKMASRIASGVEEGLLFAAAENALTVLPSLEDGADPYEFHFLRPMLMGGTLGSFVKFIGGGSSKPLIKDGAKMFWQQATKKPLFSLNDLKTMKGKMKLASSAAMLFRYPKMREIFSTIDDDMLHYTFKGADKVRKGQKIKIKTADDFIRVARDSNEGAKKIFDLLDDTYNQAMKTWWPTWWKEMGKDMYGSMPRMMAGAFVFQAPSLKDTAWMWENEPELLIFNTFLGAIMSKGGKELKYHDKQGRLRVATGLLADKRPYSYDKSFKQVDDFLTMMGDNTRNNYFDYLAYDSTIRERFVGMELNKDLDTVINILRKNGAVVGTEQELQLFYKNQKAKTEYEVYETTNIRGEKIKKRRIVRKDNKTDDAGNILELSAFRFNEIKEALSPRSLGEKISNLEVNNKNINRDGGNVYDVIQKVLASDMYSFLVRDSGGGELRKLEDLTANQIRKITKDLREADFEGVPGGKGVTDLADLSNLFDYAAGRNFQQIGEIYIDTAINIHDTLGKIMYEGTNFDFKPAKTNKDGRVELVEVKVNPADMKNMNDSTIQLINRYQNMVDFLKRHDMIQVSGSNREAIRFDALKMEKSLAEAMTQGKTELNNRVWGNQMDVTTRKSYGETWQTQVDRKLHMEIGDEFLHTWMTSVAFNRSTSNGMNLLRDIGNKNGNWKVKDQKAFNDLVGNIFEDGGFLVNDIVVPGSEHLTQIMNNTLNILRSTREYRTAFNLQSNRTSKQVSKQDARMFEQVLNTPGNGLSPLTRGDFDQRITFANEVIRKIRLHEVRNLRKSDGSLLNGNEMTKVISLMEAGFVDKNYNIVQVDGVIDAFKRSINMGQETLLVQDVINGAKMKGDQMDFLNYRDVDIPLASIFKGPQAKEIANTFKQLSQQTKVPITELFNTLLGGYNTHIKPFLHQGADKGFLRSSGVKAELSLDALMKLKYNLDFIETGRINSEHADMLNTLANINSRKDLNADQRQLASQIWGHFLDRPRDAANLILELQSVEVGGRKLYDLETKEFNWDDALAIERTNQIVGSVIRQMPKSLDAKSMTKRMKDIGDIFEYTFGSEVQHTLTPPDYINKYRITPDINEVSSDAVGQIMQKYREIINDPTKEFKDFFRYAKRKAKIKRNEEGEGNEIVKFKDMSKEEQLRFTGDTFRLYTNLNRGRKLDVISVNDGQGYYSRDNWVKDNKLTEFLDFVYGENTYVAVDYNFYENSKGTSNAKTDMATMEKFYNQLSSFESSVEKTFKAAKAGDMDTDLGEIAGLGMVPYLNHGNLDLLQVSDVGFGIGIGQQHSGKFAKKYAYFANSISNRDAMRQYAKDMGRPEKFFDFIFDKNGEVKSEYAQVVSDIKGVVGNKQTNMIRTESVPVSLGLLPKGEYDMITKDGKITKDINKAEHYREYNLNISKTNPFAHNTKYNGLFIDLFGLHTMGERFMDVRVKTYDGQSSTDVVKMWDSLKLLSNSSMVGMKSEFALDAAKVYKGMLPKKQTDFLNEIGEKGIKMHILTDEGGKGEFGHNSSIEGGSIFSTFGKISIDVKKRQKDLGENSDFQLELPTYDAETNTFSMNKGKGDASRFDSITYISERLYQALKALTGAVGEGNNGLGGFKPIIHKVGGTDGILIGKTFFGRDTRWNNYFDKNKVDMVTMDSGSKQYDKQVSDKRIDGSKYENFEMLQRAEVGSRHDIDLRLEDFSIGSIVKADHDASIQLLAMGMDLKGSELNSYHHWLLDAPLNNAKQRLAGIFDANNSNEAISWLFSLKNDAGNPAVMDAMTRAATYGAPIHNMPSFNNAFSNLLKSKLIDGGGILAPSTRYGTQSVLVPGRKLTNSTFYIKNNKRFQFDVGGARISAHNYNKTVNLKNLKIVRAKKNSPDTIEKVNVQKLAKELGIKIDWDNNTTLGEVWKALDTYNRSVKEGGDKLYVQLNGNRTPSTRPSDKLTLKLEGFKHSKEGNQLEINAYDLHLRAEGDFDVDKMNYWWDTPMSVANKWYNIAGQTGAAIGGTNKTSIKNPTFRDPQSLLEIASSREQAQKLRGRVGRIKNIINYLSHYSSGDGQVNRGLEINLGRLGGKIRVDKKKLHELWNGGDLEGGPLLHNFQEILDSKTGFDADKFSNVLNNILFGNKDRFNKSIRDGDPTNRYKGLFVLEEGKGIKQQGGRVLEKQWTKKSDFITDPIVQDIVLEVIKPYQRLLQLSTDVYEGGISRTPRWSDIMGMAREYNYSMESMYNNIYVKMKRKYKGNPTVDLIFKKNGNDKWITNNVLGTFNEAASLSGNKHSGKTFEQLLPFDRTLAELTAKDLMKAQGPRKLFGSRLIDFENWSKRFEGIDFQGDLSLKEPQSIMKEWVKDVRSDFRNMGYLNFLKYRVRNIQKMKNYAYEKGNNKLGASLDERWTRLQKQHDILAKQLKLSPKHMKTAQKYMLQELYKGLKNPRKFVKTYGKFLPKGIREDNVREWFSKNKILNGERTKIKNSEEMINRIIRKQGVIYEGVNTVEHLDNMIWHNILGHYAEVQIDMHSDFGKTYGVEFNKDITDFRRQWRKFQNARNTDRRKFKNKSLQIGGELITNDAQFANLMREVFDKKYQYWEEVGGLGNLFLTKVMTPEVNPMKLSYFGNKLGPSFFNSTADNMFIKFGINWVNNTELKSNMDKNQWFSHTMGNYRRLHDKFHGNGFDAKIFAKGTEEAGHLQFMERYQGGNKDMGILENFTKLEDILTDGWLMEKMGDTYGLPQNRTLRYLMTTQTTGVDFLAAMKESAYTSYFPQAFIEANYTGGPHPSISYGNAMKVVQGMNSALLGSNYKMSPLRLHDLPELPFNSTVNRSSKRDQSHKDADMQNFIKNKYNIECNQGGGL